MLKKAIDYSMKELKAAEEYNKMAYHATDAAMAQKFNEMAKEEIKHYEYIRSVLDKERAKEPHKEDGFCDIFVKTYEEYLDDWKGKILYNINNFKVK